MADEGLKEGKHWEDKSLTFMLTLFSLDDSIEIYRIVSNKALENSGDVIRPTGGETINVNPATGDANAAGKCC